MGGSRIVRRNVPNNGRSVITSLNRKGATCSISSTVWPATVRRS
jgi:hypothetical protein